MSLIYKIVAPILLVIFTYMSCAAPETTHTETTIYSVPVGLGDVGVVFLNENYEATDDDVGIMGMFVENNEYAKNAMLIAEIRDNDKTNDLIVRVKNTENNSLTSFFYERGMSFPDRMVLSADGEDVKGRFGFYDSSTEQYSITFSDDTGECETLRDITLNKGIFSLQHEGSASWTETQDLRLRAIYTTLAVWVSLAVHLDRTDDGVDLEMRGLFSGLKKLLKKIVAVVTVIAIAVAVVVVAPIVIVSCLRDGENPIKGLDAISVWASDKADAIMTWAGFNGSNTGGVHTLPPPSLVPLSMQWIVPGSFTMGSGDTADVAAQPMHQVTLTKGFYMGRYQVTQNEYHAVIGSNPSSFKTGVASGETQGKRPAEMVSWYDAMVFCNKLSILEGRTPVYRINGSTDPTDWGAVPTSNNATWNAAIMVSGVAGYRLPTEAEWEYACRAGTTTAYNTGDGITDDTGWYNANSGSKTHEVGKKTANAFGLYDMHGNVKEWCWDWYGTYSSGSVTDPTGSNTGTYRVGRGGGWVHQAQSLRSAYRYSIGNDPWYQSRSDGFRVVRDDL